LSWAKRTFTYKNIKSKFTLKNITDILTTAVTTVASVATAVAGNVPATVSLVTLSLILALVMDVSQVQGKIKLLNDKERSLGMKVTNVSLK
jgi:hypothetical protein